MTDMNTLTPTPEACAQTIQSLVDYGQVHFCV